ncbi:unnamed protein product [Lampetra planeri]
MELIIDSPHVASVKTLTALKKFNSSQLLEPLPPRHWKLALGARSALPREGASRSEPRYPTSRSFNNTNQRNPVQPECGEKDKDKHCKGKKKEGSSSSSSSDSDDGKKGHKEHKEHKDHKDHKDKDHKDKDHKDKKCKDKSKH